MEEQIVQNETEFRYYGFSLEQFKLENRLITKITLKNCIDNFKNKLIEKLKNLNSSPESIDKLNEYCIDDLCSKLYERFEAEFAEIDVLIDKTLSLSENMTYNFDENLGKFSEADEDFLEKEIREQESWYMQNKYMLLAMEEELEMYESLEPLIKEESEMRQKIEDMFENFNEDFGQNDELKETADRTLKFSESTYGKNVL